MVVVVEPQARRDKVRQRGLPWDRGGVVLDGGQGEDLLGSVVDGDGLPW